MFLANKDSINTIIRGYFGTLAESKCLNFLYNYEILTLTIFFEDVGGDDTLISALAKHAKKCAAPLEELRLIHFKGFRKVTTQPRGQTLLSQKPEKTGKIFLIFG